MGRVPKVTTLTQPIWPDKTIYAAMFADQPPTPDHATPQAADPDWSGLVTDYVSQTDTSPQTLKSNLTSLFDFLVAPSTITYDNNGASANGASGTSPSLTLNTTAGDELIVVVSLANTGATVSTVSDGAGTNFVLRGAQNNNTGTARVEFWSGRCALAQTPATISVTLTANSDWVLSADSMAGAIPVGNIVKATGNTASPRVTVPTQDTNNFVVMGVADPSNLTLTAALASNLRTQGHQGTTITGAIVDKKQIAIGNDTVAVQHGVTVQQWAVVGVEYRTVPPNGSVLVTHDPLIGFVDLNGNGQWDSGESVIYDADNSGTYSAGDTVIAGAAPVLGQLLSFDVRLAYYDFFGLGVWTTPDPVIDDQNANLLYDSTILVATLVQLLIEQNATIEGSLTVQGSSTISGLFTTRQIALSGTVPIPTSGAFYHFNDTLVTRLQQNSSPIIGLAFQPILDASKAPTDVTVSLFEPIISNPEILGNAVTNTTITELDNISAMFNMVSGGPAISVGTYRAFFAKTPTNQLGSGTIGTYFGLHLQPSPSFATTKFGVFQEGASDPNRLVGLTRHGDTNIPTRMMEIAGGVALAIKTVTTTYTALLTDHYILGDATTAAFTITLPSSASAGATNVALRLSFKKKDASVNAVTIAAAGADTIQGAASIALAAQYSERTLYTDGSGTWYIESTI